jgi:RNAse (barnase) inhibitor barstar
VKADVSPPEEIHRSADTRFDPIVNIECINQRGITYAVYVYDHHNYISDNICVHNSLVLEDKQLWKVLNQDIQFPETKEMLLSTANKAQLELIYGRLILRALTKVSE